LYILDDILFLKKHIETITNLIDPYQLWLTSTILDQGHEIVIIL
jgi:hypothetical protein